MSAVFLLPVCLTYRPRKYTCIDPHVDYSYQVWGWYDHPLPSWSVLSDGTLRDFVTLTFDLLTSNSCHTWRVTWPTLPQSLKPVRLCIRELTVTTSFIGYHWHCVSGYCACAVSRDVCVECKFYPHIWNPQPRFAYSLCNFGHSTMKIIKVICENNARPCAKLRDLLKVT